MYYFIISIVLIISIKRENKIEIKTYVLYKYRQISNDVNSFSTTYNHILYNFNWFLGGSNITT